MSRHIAQKKITKRGSLGKEKKIKMIVLFSVPFVVLDWRGEKLFCCAIFPHKKIGGEVNSVIMDTCFECTMETSVGEKSEKSMRNGKSETIV